MELKKGYTEWRARKPLEADEMEPSHKGKQRPGERQGKGAALERTQILAARAPGAPWWIPSVHKDLPVPVSTIPCRDMLSIPVRSRFPCWASWPEPP